MLVKKLHPDAKIPSRSYESAAGLDLYCLEDVEVSYNNKVEIKTGVAFKFDKNTYGLLRDRSSLARKGCMISGGVIDNDYTGEIIILMTLTGYVDPVILKKGDKVAQMLVLPMVDYFLTEAQDLGTTERGDKGFGSSGN
jgi:dUTP pyrophosphatase